MNVLKYRWQVKLPLVVWLVVITTIISCSFGNIRVLGYHMKGYAWVIPFIVSIWILIHAVKRISFPWYLWLPWICIVMVYVVLSKHENALQRSIMMLCPVAVGMAVSTYFVREVELRNFTNLYKKMTILFYVIVILKTGILFVGVPMGTMGLSAEVMTGALLAALFAANYGYKKKKAFLYWAGLSAIPVVALTRTAMVATGLTLPLTFAPLKLIKRAMVIIVIIPIGISLFYTERVQKRMFYSGEGKLMDLRLDNPDLFTTGRLYLWNIMEEAIERKPWFGYGANANETFIISTVGFQGQPHNDWLRLRFDYGYVGTFVFCLCMLLQTIHAWKKGGGTTEETRILFYAGVSSFLPFVLFMLTDNIIIYVSFFGNFQFTILGLAYASLNTSMRDAAWYRYQTYLSSLVESNNSFKKVGTSYEFTHIGIH